MFGHSANDAAVIETEPQVIDFLVCLVKALKPRYVIETGTYHGRTAQAIGEVIAGHLDTIETDAYSVNLAKQRLLFLPVEVHHMNSLDFIPDRSIEFAFLDSAIGNHRLKELEHFAPYLAPEAVVAIHDSRDVFGPTWPEFKWWRWVQLPTPRGLLLLQAA